MALSISRYHLTAAGIFLLIVAPLSVWAAVSWVSADAMARVQERGQHTLNLFIANLESEIEKYAFLPEVLSADQDIVKLLLNPDDQAQLTRVNHKLARVNAFASASDTYVMQANGLTLAASNWDQPLSFVGRNFSFRPYFRKAMEGANGRYFALGTTSKKRGYYFSAPVFDSTDDAIIGAAVVKVGLDRLEQAWHGSDVTVLVTDERSVIFAANRPDWLFRTLRPLQSADRQSIESTKQYLGQALQPLRMTALEPHSGANVIEIESDDPGKVDRYLMHTSHLATARWTAHTLIDLRAVSARVNVAVWLVGLGLAIVLLAVLFAVSRRMHVREQLSLREHKEAMLREARDRLEQRVEERTAELQASHDRLQQEIIERQRAHEELVQAGKLAALGQMSAGITHELNQPLAAIQTYAQNAREFLKRGRHEITEENLVAINELTERMSQITSHLKSYSRKSDGIVSDVNLRGVVDDALALVAAKVRQLGVRVHHDVDPDSTIRADPIRLAQVVLNLVNNALDAMEAAQDKHLHIEAVGDSAEVTLRVRDSGAGIPEDHLGKLFDPFFTTKGVGEGLGLGLSISYSIVKNFGGELRAANHPDGGAEFSMVLQRAHAAVTS